MVKAGSRAAFSALTPHVLHAADEVTERGIRAAVLVSAWIEQTRRIAMAPFVYRFPVEDDLMRDALARARKAGRVAARRIPRASKLRASARG
jgi:hypothetical protein